jgi:hypothetical protein
MKSNNFFKKLMRNKRATFLMVVSIALVFSVIGGLTTYYLYKNITHNMGVRNSAYVNIGTKQLYFLLDTYQAEKDLLYLDLASKYASEQSLIELAENGLYYSKGKCGEFLNYQLWNDPSDIDSFCQSVNVLDDNFQKKMDSILFKYTDSYNENLPNNFEFSLLQESDDFVYVLAKSKTKMIYPIDANGVVTGPLDSNDPFDPSQSISNEVGNKISYGSYPLQYTKTCLYCNDAKNLILNSKDYECLNLNGQKCVCMKGDCLPELSSQKIPFIPFFSQCGSWNDNTKEGCYSSNTLCYAGSGAVSSNIVLNAFGIPIDLDYFKKDENNNCFSGITSYNVNDFLVSKGLDVQRKSYDGNDAWDNLVKETKEGPVIILEKDMGYTCSDSSSKGSIQGLFMKPECKGSHFSIVVFANDNYAIMLDSGSELGYNLVVSKEALLKSWGYNGYSYTAILTKPPTRKNEVVILESKENLFLNQVSSSEKKWVKYYPVGKLSFDKPYVVSIYGYRDIAESDNLFHYGVDFRSRTGKPTYAVADGIVTIANDYSYHTIEIDHGNGYKTRYLHSSEILVKKGDKINAGQIIAKSGGSGPNGLNHYAPHLHFEIWKNGVKVDPLLYFYNFDEGLFSEDVKFKIDQKYRTDSNGNLLYKKIEYGNYLLSNIISK